MKNTLLIFALFFGVSVFAQDAEENKVEIANQEEVTTSVIGSNIVFEETIHEFGIVSEGDKASHIFQFINDGTEPLILTNVKASCGCTTPKWPREPIMPGETGEVEAIYNSKGRPGKFNKAITITSNSTANPTVRVFIKGEVQKIQAVPTIPSQEKSILDTGSN